MNSNGLNSILLMGCALIATSCNSPSSGSGAGSGSGSGSGTGSGGGGVLQTTPVGLPGGKTASGSVTFQNGLSYSGASAIDISDSGYSPGGADGMTFGDNAGPWCIGQLHAVQAFGYNISPLFKFDNLWVPVGKLVLAVSLQMQFVNWNPAYAGSILIGRYLNRAWDYTFTESNGGVGNAPTNWAYALPGEPWNTPGALGEGTDLIANISFNIPSDGSTTTANGIQVYTTWLDPTIVQNWIDHPDQNYGFKLQANGLNKHTAVYGPRLADTSTTPKLVIYYQ